jgi:hypothetical protein
MTTSTIEIEVPAVNDLTVSLDTLTVEMNDGRTLSVPLAWYPRLTCAKNDELSDWRVIGQGHGIHWPQLDEDISIQNLIAGKRSGESQRSFGKWLESRA